MKVNLAVSVVASIAVMTVGYAALRAQTPPIRSTWDGVYSEAQATRGKQQYEKNCAACHGQTLESHETASSLTGLEFRSNWNGLTLGDLLERMRTTMPANSPGRLSRDLNTDILTYILKVNEFPAGSAELPADVQVQQQIRFLATKPEK